MKRGWTIITANTALLAMLALTGCGGGAAPKVDPAKEGKTEATEPGEKTSQATGETETTELSITPQSKPDEVVVAFLEARRSGDSDATTALLTSIARTETAKHKIDVNNQAVPDLQYQVGQPKILKDNPKGAHVSSIWTEPLEDGTKASYEIVWVLRRESEGWRIAGMAAELIPGTQPQFLNFEDPADLIKKQEEAMVAAQQAEAAAQAAAQQATAPPQSEGKPLRKR